jgi:hypothetical protein
MRRIAQTFLCLALSGCGYSTWADLPFSTGTNPNRPVGDSENMRRAMGELVEVRPLTTEPGDVWPGPLAQEPTLEDIEKQGLQSEPERPVPGSPEFQSQNPGQGSGPSQNQPPNLPPAVRRGSSTPPPNNQQGLAPLPPLRPPQATNPTPPGRNPAGQVYPTQNGPVITNGGTGGYQTTTTPGGGSAIVVPNGNGTSTIIHSNGTIETVPTPR